MKTTKFISALMAIFAIAFLSTLESCTKETTDEPTAPTKTGLITSEGWIMESGTMTFAGQTINTMDFMDDYEKDDILYIKSDKSILMDAGALKCDPTDPQTESGGTWAFNSTETGIIVTEGTDVTELSITTLSSTTLVLEFTEYDSTFQAEISATFTYKH